MKKLTLIIGLLYSSFSFSQTYIIEKDHLNKSLVKTGVLFEKVKTPDTNLLKFKAKNNLTTSTPIEWLSLYHNIYQATYQTKLKHFLTLEKKAKTNLRKGILDIAFLNYRFNKIDENAFKNGEARFEKNKIILQNTNDIKTHTVFAVAPILSKNSIGRSVIFNFDSKNYFSNYNSDIEEIIIDFNDGLGERKIRLNSKIKIDYTSDGFKIITTKITLKNKKTFKSNFKIEVNRLAMPMPSEQWNNFTADIPYNGSASVGDVAVFLGNGNSDFTRPVIISDGFDPGDTRDIPQLYDLVNQQQMVENLRAQGYDLIIVNFHAGDDFIQRNAMLLVKVIQQINNRMQQAGTMKTANQIVVVGPSMSGLVSRYALDYMEQNNLQPNVRNWIAFDSPMKGANIPLGLQHWLRFYADVADVAGAQQAIQALQGPAAKQMLTYYYTATSGQTANHHPLFTSFYNEINAMGFPQQTRKVAISNGSGFTNGQPYGPGAQTINYRYRSFLVDLDGDVWAEPNQYYKKIFYGVYDELGWWSYEEENIYVNNTNPLDSAPGGTRATFQELANTNTGGYGNIEAYYPNHAFIPTISALSLNNTTNPYYNIHSNINTLTTNFDKLYYPNWNQEHVQITGESYQWFEHEIVNYAPTFTSTPTTTIDEESNYSYTLQATDINEWNTLNFEIVNLPSWLSYDAQTKTISGIPHFNDIGFHTVSIKVTDGLDETIQTFQIQVNSKCTSAPITEWNGNNWSNGTPNFSNAVVLNGNYNTAINGNIEGCSLKISNGKELIIEENYPVVIERNFDNSGTITVKNNASFVQTSDKGNIFGNGNFTVERSVNNLTNYYNMVYWSSPLNSTSFSLGDLLPNAWRYYSFDALNQSWNTNLSSAILESGLGYVISAPTGFTGGNISVNFHKNNDVFNNGIVSVPVTVNGIGATDDNDWNLLGNPYPSAIDFHKFVQDNPNIQGSYYLWTNCAGLNGNDQQQAGYSVYSLSGGTSACQGNGITATQFIPSTQGFFIEANTSGTVSFNNSQRVSDNNGNFASRNANESSRLWLEMTSDNQNYKQILIDFNANATNEIDRLYDAKSTDDGSNFIFYSLSQNTKLSIQALPELDNEAVYIPLGYTISGNENLHIHLSNFENDLINKNIYVIDNTTNSIYNLKQDDYHFTDSNSNENRLQLLITNRTLSTNNEVSNPDLRIYHHNNTLTVLDKKTLFNEIEIMDFTGKLLYAIKGINTNSYTIPFSILQPFVIVRVTYSDKEVSKKIIIRP